MAPPPFESKDLTVISYRRRTLEMYPVLHQELRTLVSGYTSVYLALFGMTFGAFVTLLITVLAVPLETNTSRVFKDATVITGLFTVLLCVMACRDWWRSNREMEKLRTETKEVEVRPVEPAGS